MAAYIENYQLAISEAEHKTLLLIGDPQAEAWAWINRYLENINSMIDKDSDYGDTSEIDMYELLSTAESHLSSRWGDYIIRGGSFEGYPIDSTFWDKFATVLDIEIPYEKRGSFFSCSC